MAEFTEFPLDLPQAEAPKQPESPEKQNQGRGRTAREGADQIRGRIDLTFLLLTLLLLGVGLVMMLSASYVSAYYDTVGGSNPGDPLYYFRRQVLMAILGLVLMVFLSRLPYGLLRWQLLPYLALAAAAVLMILVTVIGRASHGAVRWVQIGGIRFQPSELLKAALVYFFAYWGSKHADRMGTFRIGALPHLVLMLGFAGLLMLQPHLSATMIVVGITLIMMWASGTRWYYVVGFVVLMWLLYLFAMANREWLTSLVEKFTYIYSRIDAWQDPEKERLGEGWQILQSLYAIGSGGLLGLGLGQSRQKYLYLPEEHNDYIFSIICEELGFIGAVLILLLFAVLIIRGYWLAMHCRNRFDALLITGFTSLLFLQVFLNVAVVTNFLPSTGISLPFFSYGGTALIMQLGEVGLILLASRGIPDK